MKKFMVVTLCGSVRTGKQLWDAITQRWTLEGLIVLKVDVWEDGTNIYKRCHEGDLQETKKMLDEMHKRKIELSDFIYVINKNGYIGNSTKSEIKYAKKLKKPVLYLEEPKQ